MATGLPEQPLDWTLELLPSGNFTARRQEWLQWVGTQLMVERTPGRGKTP
jgi:hypothetical protein